MNIRTTDSQALAARIIVLEHVLKRTTKAKVTFALCFRMQRQWRVVQAAMTDPEDVLIYQQLIDACQYFMDMCRGAKGVS